MSPYLPNAWILVYVLSVQLYTSSSTSTSAHNERYGVVLDAGSSGTKIKAYRWQRPNLLTELPHLHLLHGSNLKIRPGIGHFARHHKGQVSYMTTIIDRVKKLIPEDAVAHTPLYMMATAGSRILDAKIALGLLNRVRTFLSNSTTNPFLFSPKNVRILSGEEEAVYAWIALNSLTGFFDDVKPPSESLGVLEMGGGSTQIAFIPEGPLYAGEFQIHLAGRRFDLYAHSYLFFGSNYMRRRLNRLLTSTHVHSDTVDNPCMLVGDQTTFKDEQGNTFELRGTGNPDDCVELIRHFVKKSDVMCQPKPCALGSVYQPSVGNLTFYATQGFVYTPQNLKALEENKLLNLTKLQYIGREYCKKSLARAIEQPNINHKFASDECFMSLYIPLLLRHGYGLSEDTNVITVTNKLHDNRIDWTLGVMLYEQSMNFQSERLKMIGQRICVTDQSEQLAVNSTDDGVAQDTVGYTVEPELARPAASHDAAECVHRDAVTITLTALLPGIVLASL